MSHFQDQEMTVEGRGGGGEIENKYLKSHLPTGVPTLKH